MSEPIIHSRHSLALNLEPGTYYWCRCGRSKLGGLCDGCHKGTDFRPLPFEVKESGTVHLCLCKHTKTPPYCDGTHKNLP
jgi:CDGSH iron-sulfur domain-containing protein 3